MEFFPRAYKLINKKENLEYRKFIIKNNINKKGLNISKCFILQKMLIFMEIYAKILFGN